MSGLVSDDIMREAGENRPIVLAGEVSKEQGTLVRRIECVGIGEGMRCDAQLVAGEAPIDATAERSLEAGERLRDGGVDILRVELRVREDGAVACLLEGINQIARPIDVRPGVERREQLVGRRIEIDNLHSMSPRSRI